MRLDLFLKTSRLCLRRTIAQELCEAGAVFVNGAPAKASRAVRAGDHILLRRRDRELNIRVTQLPALRQVARSEASHLYEILSEEIKSEKPFDY
jgi:ribosomal 50S subunit-recycling heat shock protein